jgi:hypothetical protein
LDGDALGLFEGEGVGLEEGDSEGVLVEIWTVMRRGYSKTKMLCSKKVTATLYMLLGSKHTIAKHRKHNAQQNTAAKIYSKQHIGLKPHNQMSCRVVASWLSCVQFRRVEMVYCVKLTQCTTEYAAKTQSKQHIGLRPHSQMSYRVVASWLCCVHSSWPSGKNAKLGNGTRIIFRAAEMGLLCHRCSCRVSIKWSNISAMCMNSE